MTVRAFAFALVLAGIASAEVPNKSRRLQSGGCADLDGDGAVNVTGARVPLLRSSDTFSIYRAATSH